MKKVKYFYNTHKLKFEKIETPLRVRLLQAFGFIAASIVTGLIIMSIVFRYVEKPNEKFFLFHHIFISLRLLSIAV